MVYKCVKYVLCCYSSFLYIRVIMKKVTSTSTMMPAVIMLDIAETIMPVVVLMVLKSAVVSRVFLKERFSFRAHKPGITRSATTRIVPITFMDSTMVMAVSRSKSIVSLFVGMPLIFESSSSKIMERSSRRKKPMNSSTIVPKVDTRSKSESVIVNMDPKR